MRFPTRPFRPGNGPKPAILAGGKRARVEWSHDDRTNRIEEIFQDARELQADALDMLALGKIRNAAEKAWGATKRATALWYSHEPAREPERTPETGAGLRMLASLDEAVREVRLLRRYHSRQGSLHGECFYNGLCDPLEDTERRIREKADCIEDAQRLAEGDAL